jgi:tetratricopeptide (TPR) repeat protein
MRSAAMNNPRPPTVTLRDRALSIDEATAVAVRELHLGRARSAAQICDLILAAAPSHTEAINNRGVAAQMMGRSLDALAGYDRAIALQPDYAEAHLNRGNILLALGRFEEALTAFDRLITLKPEYPPAHNSRGVVLQHLKRPADALLSFQRATTLQPDNVQALNNQGLLLRQQKQPTEALARYDRVAALQPGNPEAHNNRGLALHEAGRYSEALTSYDAAVAIEPRYAAALCNRGVTLRELGRFADALASFERAIALKPDYAAAINNRGLLLRELKRYAEAVASFDRAIALAPGSAMLHVNRGVTLREMKLVDQALASCEKAIALQPDYAEAHDARAAALAQLKLFDPALASSDRAIALNPDLADAYQTRGVILVSKGNMREAETMFLKALALRPQSALPLLSLTRIRKYRDPNHEHVAAIRRLLDRSDVVPADREPLYFALGKIYDDCGCHDDAFACYRQGNRLCNAAAAYDARQVTEMTDGIIEVFSDEFFERRLPCGSQSRSPLFVIGMPRSGTTLLASMLSNHRSIATAGELPTIGEFTRDLAGLVDGGVPYPRGAERLSGDGARRLADSYEKRLRRDVGTDMPLVIDKNPLNFRDAGFIALLFPNARFLHSTRDPLDTCVSNYFQHFSLTYAYSFDLANIAHFYREYERLMNHWRKLLPGKIVDIDYQEMVGNTERVARKALEWLGLEWDDNCLTPHTNRYAVETASNWQVRQPIYGDSVGRWRHYARHLGPLREALGLPTDEPN